MKITTLDGKTPDIGEENIKKLMTMFPEVVTEGKVDFEKLKQLLGEYVDDSNERYNFTWNGKGRALRLSQTPSLGTLRPCKEEEESKDWDTTQNLYIEGDNLEVLKLLQKSYYGKVKMIYIDPPYNTGKDFVYKDDFNDSIENYKRITGQIDGNGMPISTNPETSGRYHTDWLNMMYPRLRLARNLLRDDGVIFISIDDNEVHNLRKICDEVFGEENFINILSVKMKDNAGASGGGEDKRLKKNIEYILLYTKDYNAIEPFNAVYSYKEITELLNEYRNNNISWKYTSILYYEGDKRYLTSTVDGDGNEIKIFERVNPVYKSVSQIMREENISEKEVYYKYFNKIFTTAMPQSSIRVRVMEAIDKTESKEDLYSIEYVPKSGRNKGKIYEQFYKGKNKRLLTWFKDVAEIIDGDVYKKDIKGTYWDGYNLNNLTKEGNIKFENGKKPLALIMDLIKMVASNNDIILDFFSGSATTAHAVMQLNAINQSKLKFIMVQLPEVIKPTTKENEEYIRYLKSEKLKPIVTEIGKERIRRAGEKIKEENKDKENIENLDIGFKVLKLDTSNIRKWQPDYDNLEQSLMDYVDNFVEGRTELDVVYEIMLKYGLDLTYPVEEFTIAGKKVYSIGYGMLMICLDDEITTEVAKGILAKVKELSPESSRVVFKDNGFKTDSNKTNIKEILKSGGIEEFITI
jgi:adenine-specific DNA-methyltransferase